MKGEENDTKDQREEEEAPDKDSQENGSRSQNRRRVQRFKKTVGRRRRQ